MCVPPRPECITFATIRIALAECSSSQNAHGFYGEQRLAYVVARLRGTMHPDCEKAANYLMQIVAP